jgi:hypothetical protein
MIPQIVKRYLVEWSERQEGDWFQSSKEFDSMNKATDFIESLKQTYPVESRVYMIRIKDLHTITRMTNCCCFAVSIATHITSDFLIKPHFITNSSMTEIVDL